MAPHKAAPFKTIVPQNLWSTGVNHDPSVVSLGFPNTIFSYVGIGSVGLNGMNGALKPLALLLELTLSQLLGIVWYHGRWNSNSLEEYIQGLMSIALGLEWNGPDVVECSTEDLTASVASQ